jgi:two-component system OmpR family response regulator
MDAPHILVVEDEPDIASMLNACLELFGYRVTLARTGMEAIVAAAQAAPQIVILDMKLPDMNGDDVCRHLRQDSRTVSTPVIFLSAMTQRNDIARGLTAGAEDYLTKPIDLQLLYERIQVALGQDQDHPSRRRFPGVS